MRLLTIKSMIILIVSVVLSGCFIRISPSTGGIVQNQSGTYPDCSAADTCDDIPVVDTTFDETFTAVPEDGYEFIRWIRAGGHLYGCNTNPELRISTANLQCLEICRRNPELRISTANLEALELFFNSDTVFTVAPLFQSTGPDVDFSSDFECNDAAGEEIGEGWLTYINVFEADGTYSTGRNQRIGLGDRAGWYSFGSVRSVHYFQQCRWHVRG